MNNNLNGVSIIGVGKCLPETILTNDEMSKIVETSDEWISQRTGIKQRHVLSGDETLKSLALNAAKNAINNAGIDASQVDLIISATSLPDNLYPSLACEIQADLSDSFIPAFDIVAACSGFIYALNIARNFIQTGTYDNILIVGADANSKFVDWTDRSCCVLFGDGAGAMVLSKTTPENNDILAVEMKADGKKGGELKVPLTGQTSPLVQQNEKLAQTVVMNGREIYKFAVKAVPESINSALKLAGLEVNNLDYLVPHQANIRIIEAIRDRLGLEDHQVFANLQKYGNTSAASIPIALTEALEEGKINTPSTVAITGFGAGLTWATAIIRLRLKSN